MEKGGVVSGYIIRLSNYGDKVIYVKKQFIILLYSFFP